MKITIIIDGEIGYSVKAADIRKQLDAAAGASLDVHISSPGGSVMEGLTLYNLFRDYKRRFPQAVMVCQIKGIAASMASYLAVNSAFDHVSAENNAVLMLHNVYAGTQGDHRELRRSADVVESLTNLLADAYTQKTGKSKAEILQLMDAETWYFGQEIKENGFVDEVLSTDNGDTYNRAEAITRAKGYFQNYRGNIQESAAACLKSDNLPFLQASSKPAGELLGTSADGRQVFTSDIQARRVSPDWYKNMKSLTVIGQAVVEQLLQLERTIIQEKSAFADMVNQHRRSLGYSEKYFNIPENDNFDGVIKNTDDYYRAVNKARIENGLKPVAASTITGASEDGQIKSVSDFKAEIARAKQQLH